MNSVNMSDPMMTKFQDVDSNTVTRYIYIKSLENPVKVFRETAV